VTAFWFVLGLALMAIEVFTLSCALIFFGAGAWAAALTSLAGGGLWEQTAAFALSSVLSLLVLRKRLRAVFSGRARGAAPPEEHPLAGRTGVVSRAIRPGEPGEIQVGGSFWRAAAESSIGGGETARVLGSVPGDETALLVTKTETRNSPEKEHGHS
jgi:membrane protein implicated in regulation of membrane protease activity